MTQKGDLSISDFFGHLLRIVLVYHVQLVITVNLNQIFENLLDESGISRGKTSQKRKESKNGKTKRILSRKEILTHFGIILTMLAVESCFLLPKWRSVGKILAEIILLAIYSLA